MKGFGSVVSILDRVLRALGWAWGSEVEGLDVDFQGLD
jgi:hypothetical protein